MYILKYALETWSDFIVCNLQQQKSHQPLKTTPNHTHSNFQPD